jgi:hypothetical protein
LVIARDCLGCSIDRDVRRQVKQWLVTSAGHQRYGVAELAWGSRLHRLPVALSADSAQTRDRSEGERAPRLQGPPIPIGAIH